MDTKTYNVLISSKNKKALDSNTFFEVSLQDEFFVENDEDMYVCMTQFHTIKSFYACQDGLNNHFQVILRLPNEPIAIEVFDIYIPEGNYNVKSLKEEIQKLTNNGLFDISYEMRTNKYLYKNLFQPQFEVYIKPITAAVFLGFENGLEYKIEADGTYSSKFINIAGYTSLVIKVAGDLNLENSISNLDSQVFRYDKILGVLNINDVASMDSIVFENDGCLFRHKVVGQKACTFRVQVVNEDGKEFTNMADWNMSLRFERIKTVNRFSTQEKILSQINFYLGSIYMFLNIPSRISLQDLIGQ